MANLKKVGVGDSIRINRHFVEHQDTVRLVKLNKNRSPFSRNSKSRSSKINKWDIWENCINSIIKKCRYKVRWGGSVVDIRALNPKSNIYLNE